MMIRLPGTKSGLLFGKVNVAALSTSPMIKESFETFPLPIARRSWIRPLANDNSQSALCGTCLIS